MGLTFLQQLLTIACLAFASGLLMGVALFRGELVHFLPPGRAGDRPFPDSPADAPSPRRRRARRPFNLAAFRKACATAVRDIDPAMLWVLIALGVLLSFSAIITRITE